MRHLLFGILCPPPEKDHCQIVWLDVQVQLASATSAEDHSDLQGNVISVIWLSKVAIVIIHDGGVFVELIKPIFKAVYGRGFCNFIR